MASILYTHADGFAHEPGSMHPEHPARLKAILTALSAGEFAALERRCAPKATIDQIARAHPRDYVEALLGAVPETGERPIDADTVMSPGTGNALLRSCGAVCAAVDAVLGGEAQNAFCAMRPPGHHAEPRTPMGFCFFNQVAVGAEHARAVHGLQRVAIVDFDVHHGNGTQAIFEADGGVLYASTHQAPLFPGTGLESERGVGNIVNVPLPPLCGSEQFRAAVSEIISPALTEFQPELLLISAGFDAHSDDPLASLCLTEADFAWVTEELMRLADLACDGKIVSTLEGGYHLEALAGSTAAHVRTLMTAG